MPNKSSKNFNVSLARKKTMARAMSMARSMAMSRSMAMARSMAGGSRKKLKQNGGYSQYQNNMPLTPSYSTGGFLKPSDSALANPVPFHVLPSSVNSVDNYNHYTNMGFPSKGH